MMDRGDVLVPRPAKGNMDDSQQQYQERRTGVADKWVSS